MKVCVFNSRWYFFLCMGCSKPPVLLHNKLYPVVPHIKLSVSSMSSGPLDSHVSPSPLHFFPSTSRGKLKLGLPNQIICYHLWCPPQLPRTFQVVLALNFHGCYHCKRIDHFVECFPDPLGYVFVSENKNNVLSIFLTPVLSTLAWGFKMFSN